MQGHCATTYTHPCHTVPTCHISHKMMTGVAFDESYYMEPLRRARCLLGRYYAFSKLQNAVLMEVPSSPTNIATPTEGESHWVAVGFGCFKECDEEDALSVWEKSTPATLQPMKTLAKSRTRPICAEYWEGHCDNAKCSFLPGHKGLCSFMVVSGKRGGRS